MQFLLNLKEQLYSFVKSIDKNEVFLFIVTITMVSLLIILFHYSSINKYVKDNSRCVRERQRGKKLGTYMVHAVNEKNEPMYKVTYTPSAKQFQVDCACEKGNIVNKFNNIKVYDMRNYENPVRKIQNQTCYCNKVVEPRENTYYTGYPDILRFMYNGDTSFFSSLQ